MRTISVSPVPGAVENDPEDLDGRIVDGIESLRQRIVQAIRFYFGTWFLNRNQGLDYTLLIGHGTSPGIAANALNFVIRNEGGAEVLALENLRYSLDKQRVFRYYVLVQTVYGPMPISTDQQG